MSRLIRIAAVSAIGLAMAGCSTGQPRTLNAASNYSVYSVHQPVVERNNYVFDLRVEGDRVSEAELNRLAAWFHSIDARYGDRIAIDQPRGYGSAGARGDVGRVAADFGLLLADGAAPVTPGEVAPGTIRIVASRSSARVEGCPVLYQSGHRLAGPHRLQLWLRDQLQPRRDDRQSRRSRARSGRLRHAKAPRSPAAPSAPIARVPRPARSRCRPRPPAAQEVASERAFPSRIGSS